MKGDQIRKILISHLGILGAKREGEKGREKGRKEEEEEEEERYGTICVWTLGSLSMDSSIEVMMFLYKTCMEVLYGY